MSKSRWLSVALICSFVALPEISKAQIPDSTKKKAKAEAKAVKEEADDFMHDVLRAILGPNWNLFANGGVTTGQRYELQQAVPASNGEVALKSAAGFAVGLGGGVDVLLRTGFRVSYTYASRSMNFRTNNGNGSEALDINDVGTLKSNTIALEVMRYMLPSGAAITPYGTVGVQGTWWSLHEKSSLVTSNGATPFSINPLLSFGVQFKESKRWSVRLDATMGTGHNPFTGKTSFRSLEQGQTIDEPTSVARTDFRVAAVYHFGRPPMPKVPSVPAVLTHQ